MPLGVDAWGGTGQQGAGLGGQVRLGEAGACWGGRGGHMGWMGQVRAVRGGGMVGWGQGWGQGNKGRSGWHKGAVIRVCKAISGQGTRPSAGAVDGQRSMPHTDVLFPSAYYKGHEQDRAARFGPAVYFPASFCTHAAVDLPPCAVSLDHQPGPTYVPFPSPRSPPPSRTFPLRAARYPGWLVWACARGRWRVRPSGGRGGSWWQPSPRTRTWWRT